ncbi:MFS transporter [Homoserinibacter sp. YIM 151385]|uniref:MFS transporter n=1 Tax=Homoserinibacter sp. YIM 151385 TaxID=2985506 RepID=UPI0022EFFEB0|nr:MFS transporter [Homoserinibacter sp. YIM 151385]WBU39368.1 MFS transporter [Homoserinibacter sp. YIM 151385]
MPAASREPDPEAPRAGRREWAALVVLMLPVLLISIDNTVLSFALPEIAAELRPSAAGQLWIVDIYPLVLAGLLVAMGNLGDRYGRRRMLLIGASGFGVVSALAAVAPDGAWLVAARALLGVFGAMLMPSTLSLLRSLFLDRRQRRLAIAIWATGFSVGSAIGPVVGGVLLEHFWWGSVFLIAVPVLLPLLVLAPILIRESRDPEPGPIDAAGIALSMAALAPVVFAIKHVATEGIDPLAIALAAIGVVAGALFVRRMRRRPNPMLDVGLFAVPAFGGGVVINLVSVFSLVGFLFFATQHLQLVVGLSPLDAAIALAPGVVTMIASGLLAVVLVKRIRPAFVIAGALSISLAAYVVMAITGGDAGTGPVVLAFALLGLGIGTAETLSNDLIIASVPPAKAGAASAVSETAYELGAVLGTAVLGSVLAAAYRSSLEIPAGIGAEDAAAARETLAAAGEAAERVGGAEGAVLLESARHAFDSGVLSTSLVGAALMALAVTISLVVLRRVRA